MNSFNLSIIGSSWLLIFFFLVSIAVSWFSYSKTQPVLTNFFKILLVSLRSVALMVLFFIVFEPVLNIIKASFKKPVIAILYDNSKSAGFKNNKLNRMEEVKNAINSANLVNNSDVDIYNIIFDEDAKEKMQFSFDSLNFKGELTDISKAFEFLKNHIEDKPLHSVILFSDGIYNAGTTPLYSASSLGVPVFPIGIGDTVSTGDVSITAIETNEFAYVDNPVGVRVKFSSFGYDNETVNLTISENENVLFKKEIVVNKNNSEYQAEFSFTPKIEGVRKLTATISELKDEATTANNRVSEFINILKNKRKVVLFAGYPSSDVSFINQSLSLEKGLEIKQFIQKIGSEFYTNPTKADLQDAEMIIFAGFPISSTPQNVIELLKSELNAGKPLMFIAGLQTDYKKLEQFDEFLPFKTMSSNINEFSALPNFKKEALSNPILKINGTDEDLTFWNQLPPLFKTETYVKLKPESELLSTFKVNNVALNEPLIISRKFQNKKSMAVMGYGLYRWKLLGYASDKANGNNATIDLYDKFINNSMKWLSVKNDSKNVIIKTNKRSYLNSEKINFFAQVYDESMNPLSIATVKATITGTNFSKEIQLTSIGDGKYEYSLEPLKEGEYYFSGFAENNGKKLGTDNGKFFVGESPIEYMNLSMNKELLSNIATSTSGKFFHSSETKDLLSQINKIKPIEKIPFTEALEIPIWNIFYLLIFAILLFTIEWAFRKRLGLI